MKEESFVERVLHRLIKKHIAGTTMSSALAKAKELNKKNMPASITFLSSTVDNKTKAKYITTTYMELIRRIASLNLKASVHIPAEQLGGGIDKEATINNMSDILETGNRYGVFVWAELAESDGELAARFENSKGFGVAVSEKEAVRYLTKYPGIKSAKLLFDEEKWEKGMMKDIGQVAESTSTAVLVSPPEKLVKDLLNGSKYKKSFVFEFKLGYSSKRLNKVIKKGGRVSVNVPFGKDWTGYAMNKVSEGYMRFLMSNLLKEDGKKGF